MSIESNGAEQISRPADGGAPSSSSHSALIESRHPFAFTGSGSEYFGIWIVNIVLSILTLGIYSAWAKVRRLQYFHRHTQIAGSSFDFHGKPIDILKGRAIAFAAYAAYFGLSQVSITASLVLALALFIVIPFFIYKSLRFRMHNTSWRRVRFKFMGKVPGAYGAFVGWPILAMFSVYLLAPVAHHQINSYTLGNSALGTTLAKFKASIGAFYKVYLKTFGLFLLFTFATAAIVWALAASSQGKWKSMLGNVAAQMSEQAQNATRDADADEDEEANKSDSTTTAKSAEVVQSVEMIKMLTMVLPLLIVGFYLFAFLAIGPYFSSRIGNVIWNGLQLGPMRFESTLSARKLTWISVSNFIAILLTLGFYRPFAAVRMAKYRVSCLSLIAAGPLAVHAQAIAGNVNARGEEIAEMFDVDVGI